MAELLPHHPQALRPAVPGMAKPNARKGGGLRPRVSSLEPEHPLVTRWKSSLKDTSLGSTSSQGPGRAAVHEDSHSRTSPTLRVPPTPSSRPVREGQLGYHFRWVSPPLGKAVQLSHTAPRPAACSQFHEYFSEPIPRPSLCDTTFYVVFLPLLGLKSSLF